MARLELDRVAVTLGGNRVLHGVSLDVADGECVALLGPSGCGKTTTLRAIAGFTPVASGEIRIAGHSVLGLPPHKRNLGLVFQDYALFPHMNVAQNIGYGLRMRGVDRGTIAKRVEEALSLVRLDEMAERFPARLSGGQRQRVALARALVIKPDILLLDEPLGALDRKLRDAMQVELKRIHREVGVTTIIVTHDQEEALSLADRVAVMFAGDIREVDKPAQLYARPRSRAVMDFLGEANFLPADVTAEALLRLPGGALLGLPDGTATTPRPMRIGIRPEHMLILAEAGSGSIPARVLEIVYKGAHAALYAQGPEGLSLSASLPAGDLAAPPVIGDTVHLRPDPARMILFEENAP
ncbi:ABC transporter ATP-binding protein [Sediminicoccus sp. KRV36]|uniref:ABC transporter ATP-binding protein n=1 Tax=Sediminicoccus sp. KRV36 TaxID=3133721 RepID=UPI0020106CCA|nr:ABC transporter ATP-binding protein [Sediminicoccus rosea]UPY36273.1 ABC transporter ATP-binding protein [Sediminicoccus rosea]